MTTQERAKIVEFVNLEITAEQDVARLNGEPVPFADLDEFRAELRRRVTEIEERRKC